MFQTWPLRGLGSGHGQEKDMLSPEEINRIMRMLNGPQPGVKLGFELSPKSIEALRAYPAQAVYPLLFGYYKGLEDSMPYICDLDSYHLEANDHKYWKHRYTGALFALEVDHLQYLLTLWMECDNPKIRAWGCFFLQDFPCPEAVEALCRVMLNDPSPDVRSAAAESLIEIGDPSALPALEEAVLDIATDSDHYSVSQAAKAAIEIIRARYEKP